MTTERGAFWRAYQSGEYSMAELCRQFGISRKSGYQLVRRVQADGEQGLRLQSRAPHRHPNQTPADVVAAIVRAKTRHPSWGPRKLEPGRNEPQCIHDRWPAPSTIGDILLAHGLVTRRRRKPHSPPFQYPLGHATGANDVWCADFKGWFRTGDGHRCDPFTVTDAHSRMLLGCDIVPRPTGDWVKPLLDRYFCEFGVPLALRTDNGPPFASVGAGGLSSLAIWWIKLGILPERIQPGHPEQNGRHERFHRTLKQETASPPARSLREQQQRFDAFRQEYNHERPHEALGQLPPASRYQPSPRRYPCRLQDPIYDDAVAVRRVRSNGEMKWAGRKFFVSEQLVGEVVGIDERGRAPVVRFGPIILGWLDLGSERLVHPRRGADAHRPGAPGRSASARSVRP